MLLDTNTSGFNQILIAEDYIWRASGVWYALCTSACNGLDVCS